jgi:hypothetical protein
MKNKLTIPAFSIIEAVVGMAIMAIIMGIIFVIFSIVIQRMLDYKNQNQLVNDLNRLTYSINKDIFENQTMDVFDKQVLFKGYTTEKVSYDFLEDYTLRSREAFVDTFKIKLKSMNIDSVKTASQKMVFQKIQLKIEVNEKNIDLNFYKRVYPDELLQKIKS